MHFLFNINYVILQEDTILGLARFLEPENWEFTCTLAKRYKVDTWIIAATHTEVGYRIHGYMFMCIV